YPLKTSQGSSSASASTIAGPGEPMPGGSSPPPMNSYRLIERIGTGGFAEVWRAEAPGGVPVAVKIVYQAVDEKQAQGERHSLELMKQLNHPFLLQTHAYWVQGGRLHVAMELAEGSLRDRLKQCQKQNLPGIPVDELFTYIREAGEALD